MTQHEIEMRENALISYDIVDREDLKRWQFGDSITVDVSWLAPSTKGLWTYVVRFTPRDSSDVPASAALSVRKQSGDTDVDPLGWTRSGRDYVEPLVWTRRGRDYEWKFNLFASHAPSSTLVLALGRSRVHVMLEGFPPSTSE